MNNILSVKNEDFERLRADETEDFFRELLWAEARRIGLPISKIDISSRTNVSDGGIDATVKENKYLEQNDLIKTGYTAYQIKAGTSFKPWQESKIKKELFGSSDNEPNIENLKDKVEDCLERSGTYVLVCFKQDPQPQKVHESEELIKDFFIKCGYENAKVEVWGQSKIVGFFAAIS